MNQPEAEEEVTRRSVVGRISHAMTSGELSTGDLAELRRISPDEPYTPALWKVLVTMIPESWTLGAEREDAEKNWAAVLMAMGITAGLHDPQTRFGAALARAGYSELRFVRLMRSSGDQLHAETRRLAQFLSSKSQPTDLADVANLILDQSGEWREKHRRRIARDYYRELFRIESQN